MSVGIGTMSLKDNQHTKRFKQTRKVKKPSSLMKDPGLNIPMFVPQHFENSLKGSDFYKFVNGKWLRSVNVPPYISSYGISEELEQSIKKTLQQIIQRCIQKSKESLPEASYEDSIEISLGNIALSALNPKVQKKSVKSLETLCLNLRCMRDSIDIARTMGELTKYKIPGMFWLYSQYENQNKTKYTYTIGVGKVGLPDLSYYKKTAPGKSKTLLKYANLLQTVGKMFDIENLSSVLPLEELLAGSIQKSFSEKTFEMKGSELAKEFPHIPFETLFMSIGLSEWKTEHFFVDSRNWMETIQKLFQFLPLDMWKLLFATEIILHFLPYLPPPFDDLHFQFFRNYLRGQTEKIPQKDLTVNLLQEWMSPFLSKLYVKYQDPSDTKRETGKFVKQLITATKDRLEETEWLQPTTRKKAVEKVEKMIPSIAYPDSFAKLTVPMTKPDNLVENLLTIGTWQTSYEISRLGEKRDEQKDWDEPIFAVNAYYYSQSNEIVIPLGSIYWPFYSHTAPLGWNHGGLGCILAHEITHAFDKDGKEYDPDGFPKKWWTPSDNRAYNKRTKNLVQLFSQEKILDHPVSGSLTLSENIADLGGMAIALDALDKELEKNKEKDKKKAYQQFFLSYAVSWRVKEKPEKVLQSLFLDYHAPPSLRVNLIVSQFDEWYEAFDITEKDPMYIPPEKRICIF
jgi:putative endopeptidase